MASPCFYKHVLLRQDIKQSGCWLQFRSLHMHLTILNCFQKHGRQYFYFISFGNKKTFT